VEAALETGPLVLRSDHQRLEQALTGLVASAVRAAPEGGRVRLRATPTSDEGVAIVVEDRSDTSAPAAQGAAGAAGRPAQARAQAGAAAAPSDAGATMARQFAGELAEAHGGRLSIAEAARAGSAVAVMLPPDRILGTERPARAPAAVH
ncbi:MAG: ATP-binding protein, partial [Pseudomonadota bacterium]